ncbi:MAG: hypothetical protein AAF614_35290, partial [Chloroflexota bacterium]
PKILPLFFSAATFLKMTKLTRTEIINALVQQLEPLEGALALWEAGSAAFGRVDAYSDIDLHIIVADDAVEEIFQRAETTLRQLSPISDIFRVPEPTWHGHSQAFYTLENASPFLLIDFAVMKLSSEDKFLQPEVHGEAVVLFDKVGAITAVPFDHEAHQTFLQKRVGELEITFKRYQAHVVKEILRGNVLNAMHFYPHMTLGPLRELLRIKYDPTRPSWGQRYLSFYLPPEDREKLESLNLIKDLADLEKKQKMAEDWVGKLVEELSR